MEWYGGEKGKKRIGQGIEKIKRYKDKAII
jgi:hypothetical protein